jgi:hypothetical protein
LRRGGRDEGEDEGESELVGVVDCAVRERKKEDFGLEKELFLILLPHGR